MGTQQAHTFLDETNRHCKKLMTYINCFEGIDDIMNYRDDIDRRLIEPLQNTLIDIKLYKNYTEVTHGCACLCACNCECDGCNLVPHVI